VEIISKTKLSLVLLVGIALIRPASSIAGQAQAAGQAPGVNVTPGDPAKGKALYAAHQCWACHGYNGETGTPLLRDNGTFATRLSTVSTFINFIRAPRPNEPPPARSSTSMPSYGVSPLPNQSAADLYAYIKTFKPTQPALKDIPVLNQMIAEGGKLKK